MSEKARTALWIVLLMVVSTALSFYYQSNQWVSGDQWQMLNKGLKAAIEGIYLPYGNEASTVGNVPGSLSSFVIGWPLSLWFDPYAPVVFLQLIRMAGFLLFVNAISKIFSRRTVLAGAVIYALNPWFLYDSLVYNPSYLSFGAALVLNMIVRLKREEVTEKKPSFIYTFVCSMFLTLGAGWCMQLHFSWPVLVALTGILWLLRGIRFNFAGAALGLVIIGISLIPYYQETLVNEYITSNPEEYAKERYFGYGLVHVYPLFKALMYWLRFGSLLVTKKTLIPELGADAAWYQDVLYYAYLVFTQGLGVITVVISAVINYKLIFRARRSRRPEVRFVRALTISNILALLLAAAAATLTLNYWQIIILFCFALMPILTAVESRPLSGRVLAALAALMVVLNLVSATSSDKFSLNADYSAAFYQHCINLYDGPKCHLTDTQTEYYQNLHLPEGH